jgi:hypothetical protein
MTTPTTPWTRANALRVRAKSWTGYSVTSELAHVGPDGRVYLWDDCSSTWTTCHRLNARAQARIRKAGTAGAAPTPA